MLCPTILQSRVLKTDVMPSSMLFCSLPYPTSGRSATIRPYSRKSKPNLPSDRVQILASEFRSRMAKGRTFESHGEYRTKFYHNVSVRAQQVVLPSFPSIQQTLIMSPLRIEALMGLESLVCDHLGCQEKVLLVTLSFLRFL